MSSAEAEPAEATSEPPTATRLGYAVRDDGRYEAFVEVGTGRLILRDLRSGVTKALFDRRLKLGPDASLVLWIGEDHVGLVIENITHMRVAIAPFRIVDVHLEGR